MKRARHPRSAAAAAAAIALTAGIGAARAGELDVAMGRKLFARAWVPAPSSTAAADGLGPLHNARSCAACHAGLARAPVRVDAAGTVTAGNLVLRVSDGAGRADPVYGVQIQTSGLPGVPPEARPAKLEGRFAALDLAYGPLAPGTRVGARLAPALAGLGRLAEVPEAAILAVADEQARGPDGVRGRPSRVSGPDGSERLGRFGLKASAATLTEQVETAFALDLGMSTLGRAAPEGDCTAAQASCRAAPHGGSAEAPEAPAAIVALIAAFLAEIRPPEPGQAGAGPGAALFEGAGCAVCHRPALPSPAGPVRAYTDLLLHDLGPGLDGGATEPGVAPTEWRTAPLWGLSRTLAAGAGLLHDGRARDVAGAVRLHGGTAAASRTRFEALPAGERRRLLDFVSAL